MLLLRRFLGSGHYIFDYMRSAFDVLAARIFPTFIVLFEAAAFTSILFSSSGLLSGILDMFM